jgi:hypothetical protein
VQRLLVRLVKRFEKRGHEAPARRVAAELGEIDDADERFTGDHPAERGAHLGGDRHVGMPPAKHHDRIAGRAAVGARAQSPPHPERIHDRHPSSDIEQPLDKTLGRIGLAGAGGADDRDPVVERVGRKRSPHRIAVDDRHFGEHAGMTVGNSKRCACRLRMQLRTHGDLQPTAGPDKVFVHDSFDSV